MVLMVRRVVLMVNSFDGEEDWVDCEEDGG